jgi:uncharacterized protein (DUF2147 family)
MIAAALALTAGQAMAADPAEGDWLVQGGQAKVRIARCPADAQRLCGDIVWLQAPRETTGAPKRDVHNPDPALRARPLLGLQLIRDFRPAGDGRWTGGKIYDPKSGRTYDSKLRIAGDGTLKLDGCISVLCQTQTWTRTGPS